MIESNYGSVAEFVGNPGEKMAASRPQGTMSFSLWPWLAEASWKANRARFILYCRAGVFYCEDTVTRKTAELKNKGQRGSSSAAPRQK
jgi:hypothetical protein